MPIDLSLLTKIAESIADLVESASKAKAEKRERLKTALKAVLTAALDTKRYLSTQKNGIYHDQEEETNLSGLWRDASVDINEFDDTLSDLCLNEAEYWADPPEWNFREINNAKRILQVITYRIKLLMD
jgi:hypothetical protein